MIQQMLTITKKDLRDLLRNATLVFVMIMPLALGLLYNFIPDTTLNIGYVGQDPAFMHVANEDENMQLHAFESVDALEGSLDREMHVGIVTEKDGRVTIIGNESRENAVNTVTFMYLSTEADIDMSHLDFEQRLIPDDRVQFDLSATLGGLSIMMGISLVGLMVMPTLLVAEKEKGTLRAMVTTGIRFSTIIGSKALTGFLLCSIIAFLAGFFSKTQVSVIPIYMLFVFLGALFITLMGLIIASLSENETTLNEYSSMGMLLFIAPAAIENFNLPEVVDSVMRFIPTYWMYEGIKHASRADMLLTDVLPHLFIMIGSIIAAFVLAVFLLKRASQRIV